VAVTDKTFIKKSRHLLWFHLDHAADGTIGVHSYYRRKSEVGERLKLNIKLSAKVILRHFEAAISTRKKPRSWKSQITSTERIIAQIAARGTRRFDILYYSIGIEKSGELEELRLASYFILDAKRLQPELPGFFDFQSPVPAKSIEEFFGLTSSAPKDWHLWCESKVCFKTEMQCAIVLRRTADDGTEYIGLDVTSELHDYPLGRLVGGLPFGAENKFLALCRIESENRDTWRDVLKDHEELFRVWNVICRKGSMLKRVFIKGEPGSGKELWFEAIKEGSRPHRKIDKWKTLSATLPTDQLQKLLYGEQSGALERQGFLASCADGGVFIDEIGKSDPAFRKDLLRVLESREYVPVGGLPTSTRNVLFVFASTPTDRENAFDPPDFWTRMDVEVELPHPILLMPWSDGEPDPDCPFNKKDSARFYALLGTFWFSALKEQLSDIAADPKILLKGFFKQVFSPIEKRLAVERRNGNWPVKWAGGISVSPRRVKSLAATFASEYQWLAYESTPDPDDEQGNLSVADDLTDFLNQFVHEFYKHLVQDRQNNDKLEQATERRRWVASRAGSS
jgi:Sigma-54 interaction domain